jgi:hypothetical protein
MKIPYDPTRVALLDPSQRPAVFGTPDFEARDNEDGVLAECARLAYVRFERGAAERQRLAAELGRVGIAGLRTFSDPGSGTQAWSAALPDGRLLLAFRGTEPDDIADLGADLHATQCDWARGGRVHAGFANAFLSVNGRIAQELGDALAPARLVITGHSLGAALATLAASWWKGALAVTFGSPRVGNPAFVQTIAPDRSRRYVDCCDIVTRVPSDLAGLYEHTAVAIPVDSAGILRPGWDDAASQADRRQARTAYVAQHAWVSGNVMVRDLADHAPINYVRAFTH